MDRYERGYRAVLALEEKVYGIFIMVAFFLFGIQIACILMKFLSPERAKEDPVLIVVRRGREEGSEEEDGRVGEDD